MRSDQRFMGEHAPCRSYNIVWRSLIPPSKFGIIETRVETTRSARSLLSLAYKNMSRVKVVLGTAEFGEPGGRLKNKLQVLPYMFALPYHSASVSKFYPVSKF